MRRVARKLALVQVAALVILGVGLASCGYPTAPECGMPNSAHTAAISADPAVACFVKASKHCTSMELDVLGDGFSNSVDEHFIVTPNDHCRIDDYVVYDYNSVQTTALDWRCTSFAQLPDWGLVLTGCTPAVDCYSTLGAPLIDPPAVAPSMPPNATPTPAPSPAATDAPAGSPAVNGRPHC
jgi:hypothetical protein